MNRRGKTKEGFLYVKQPSRFGKAWKRKWIVIRPNTTKGSEQASVLLELYLEKGAYNKTVTSLLLEGVTRIRRVVSKSQPRAFEFVKGESSVLLTLAGDSETDAQEWIEIFRKLLLPASEQKELTSVLGYGTDVVRVSVIPNKDSERLKLTGSYLAGVSRLSVTLHSTLTGDKVLEWDLRHMKRFMLPSKGPQQDLEKIACLQISDRSPQGEGEYLFYSPNAKPLVETIYERLSAAITVKERRSRTSSMLFEIPPKELEQLAKAIQDGGDPGFVMVSAEGSIEDEAFQTEEDDSAKINGDATDGHTSSLVKVDEQKERKNEINVNCNDGTSDENSKANHVTETSEVQNENQQQEGAATNGHAKTENDSKEIFPMETTVKSINEEANEQTVHESGEGDAGQADTSDAIPRVTDNKDCEEASEINMQLDESSQITSKNVADALNKGSSSLESRKDVATEPLDRDEDEAAPSGADPDVARHMPLGAAESTLVEGTGNNEAPKCEDDGADKGENTESTSEQGDGADKGENTESTSEQGDGATSENVNNVDHSTENDAPLEQGVNTANGNKPCEHATGDVDNHHQVDVQAQDSPQEANQPNVSEESQEGNQATGRPDSDVAEQPAAETVHQQIKTEKLLKEDSDKTSEKVTNEGSRAEEPAESPSKKHPDEIAGDDKTEEATMVHEGKRVHEEEAIHPDSDPIPLVSAEITSKKDPITAEEATTKEERAETTPGNSNVSADEDTAL